MSTEKPKSFLLWTTRITQSYNKLLKVQPLRGLDLRSGALRLYFGPLVGR